MTSRFTAPSAIALAAAVLLVAPPVARGADTAVFRCVEQGGRVLYTDVPCRNAVVVDLHPGTADPAAAQRLKQAQATLDAGMARLRADEAREAERAQAYALSRAAALAAQPPEPAPVADYWPVYGGFVGPIRPRHHHGVSPRPIGPGKPRPPQSGAKPPRPPRTDAPRIQPTRIEPPRR